MKRKKQLLLMSLTALLVIGFGYGIYSVVPQLLAGDTQVTDLTLKSQVNNQNQTIQLTVSDQNQADTKVVVPLTDKLSYTPTKQTNAGVTYDQVNHQIVIDWLANHPKTVNLTVKAAQTGTYVFKAQTTRNDAPVNTNPTAATIKPVENTPTSSVLSDNQTSLSEKVAVPGLQGQDTTSSQSLKTKQATQQQKNSNRDLPAHADTDIVTPADFDNQPWILEMLRGYQLDISKGNVTFGDLKTVKDLDTRDNNPDITKMSGYIPAGIAYLTNLKMFWINGEYGNNISGAIPPEIGELKSLTYLNISDSKLSGPIPKEIGKLSNLGALYLENNQLSGILPTELRQLTKLTDFFVTNNYKLFGAMPTSSDWIKLRNGSTNGTQVEIENLNQWGGFSHDSFVNIGNDEYNKLLYKYINPIYQASKGEIQLSIVPSSKKLQIFDNFGAQNMDTLNIGIGSRTKAIGDATPLVAGHTYQIMDEKGNKLYDGPADSNFRLALPNKSTKYIIQMDHVKDSTSKHVSSLVITVKVNTPKVIQSLQAENPSVGTGNQIKYVKGKPFKMISTLQNNDTVDFTVGKMNEKIKTADKDKVAIDPTSFEMQKPTTTTWEAISASDVQETAEGYQVNFKDINLKPTEKIKLRYSVTAKEAFTDTAVLTHQSLLSNGQELPILNNDMTIKNGELIFKSVPATMSFVDSKIANLTTEIKRKLPDWKMQIEDSRVNKTDWHITANLISELQNSNGDSLGDSVVFKKAGQPNQVINTTSAVDVYDGKAGTTDYQDVQWGADAGPTLSVAPGLAKLGSYTGTMQWTLVDAPA